MIIHSRDKKSFLEIERREFNHLLDYVFTASLGDQQVRTEGVVLANEEMFMHKLRAVVESRTGSASLRSFMEIGHLEIKPFGTAGVLLLEFAAVHRIQVYDGGVGCSGYGSIKLSGHFVLASEGIDQMVRDFNTLLVPPPVWSA